MPGLTSSLLHEPSVALSPIPASSPSMTFRTLQDAVGRQVTLKCSDQSFLRTTLPPLAESALVERCFNSLRAALPADVYMAIAAKFYCARNAPGPADFSPSAEFYSFRSTLLTLLGFDAKSLDASISSSTSPVVESKKCRTSLVEGATDDWQYLSESELARNFPRTCGFNMFSMLSQPEQPAETEVKVSNDTPYFGYLPHVLLVLHLLYEDLKLDALSWDDGRLLATLLIPLASALNLRLYCDQYWRDFPLVWNTPSVKFGVTNLADLEKLQGILQRIETPCNIFKHLLTIMTQSKPETPYPHVKQVNVRSKEIITLFAILYGRKDEINSIAVHDFVRDFDWIEHSGRTLIPVIVVAQTEQKRQAIAVLKMSSFGWTSSDVDALPPGVGLTLRYALFRCQLDPPTEWPDEAYKLVNRQDMCSSPSSQAVRPATSKIRDLNLNTEEKQNKSGTGSSKDDDAEDGMEEVISLSIWKLLFPKDQRIQEVRRLLCSARPVSVVLPQSQQQGLSEHELIEEREKQLLLLCIRVMALSVGRGMLTLHTSTPTVTETLSVPR